MKQAAFLFEHVRDDPRESQHPRRHLPPRSWNSPAFTCPADMPTPQHDSFSFGDTRITYTVRRSRERKTIGITVCGPMVEVTAPAGMRLNVIQPYV